MELNLKYTEEDLKFVFEYARKNPGSAYSDCIEQNNKKFTNEEKKWFKFMEMAQIDIPFKKKTYTFYLLRWTGVGGGHHEDPFRIFLRKYFNGDFRAFVNCDYAEHILFTQEKKLCSEAEKWNKGEIKGLKQLDLKKDNLQVSIINDLYLDEEDDKAFYELSRLLEHLERKNTMFWSMEFPGTHFYINDIRNLKFTPVLQLIKNK